MSASEVIEKIKALPAEERRAVEDFVRRELPSTTAGSARPIRFATPAEAKAAGDKVVAQYSETFRRLAE